MAEDFAAKLNGTASHPTCRMVVNRCVSIGMADSGSSAPTGFQSWKVLRKLGSGGNSDVWLVKHDQTRVEGALKCLRRSKGISLRRFQYEIQALQALAGPGIIPLLDYHLPADDDSADAWVVMPRASEIDPDISFEELVRRMAFLAGVLANIHQKGYSHRDIKPGNLLAYDKQWVLCDFGLVSYPDKPEETPLDGKLGPLHFLAPEML